MLTSATRGATARAVLTIQDNDVLPPPPPPPPPPPSGGQPFAVGTDAGPVATVTLDNGNGTPRFRVAPFGPAYTGGVRVATGDGIADVVVGTNGGMKAVVRVVDGATGRVRPGDLSAGPWYYGAASVAGGDVTGDGVGDLAVGTDDGGPLVRVCRGDDFANLAEFAAGPGANYWGRTQVAVADLTGDGRADLAVTGQYPTGTRVAGFDGRSLRPGTTPTAAFAAYTQAGRGFEAAPTLAAGDVNGDGFADLVFGSGAWATPRVRVVSGRELVRTGGRVTLADFAPPGDAFGFGVRVGVRDADGDGRADGLVGAGTGRGSRVRAHLGVNLRPAGTPPSALDFNDDPGFDGGVFVGWFVSVGPRSPTGPPRRPRGATRAARPPSRGDC